MEEIKKQKEDTVEVVDIQFRPGQKVYFFSPARKTYRAGDHVIIDTARGPEYGTCTQGNHRIHKMEVVSPLREVLRRATEQDEKIAAEHKEKEDSAYKFCLQKVEELGLDMQLVSAEYSFDGSKILFFFTADERVDFRELVKLLASTYHTRIELRQIGVRDKARMVGGLGICGRPFCCASFLDDFQPVSIKMAKTQNLSLNPTKISGTCGRLMCCLKYEQDAYEDLLRTAPKNDSFVDTVDGRGTVTEVDLLRQRVKVQLEEHQETANWYKNEDIAVLRSGKAKKNDPPIPADLAPISGSKRRKKADEQEENVRLLDPIRLKYSEETIADETVREEAPAQQEPARRDRRRRNKAKPAPENTAAPAPEAEEKPKEEKKTFRRRHHRNRKPQAPKQ